MDVAFAVPVTLMAVPVALGDRVRAGDVLAESEAAPYRHAAEGAWASLASAEAEAVAARVAAEQARTALASAEALLAAGAVSEAEVVAASYGADAAGAALASARARAAEQRAGARQRSSEVASRTITAPFDGVVTRRAADRGAVPAGVAIVRVIDDREFRVRFGVDRATAGRLAVGDRVCAADPTGGAIPARVDRVSPEVDPYAELVIAEAVVERGGARVAGGVVHVSLGACSG